MTKKNQKIKFRALTLLWLADENRYVYPDEIFEVDVQKQNQMTKLLENHWIELSDETDGGE